MNFKSNHFLILLALAISVSSVSCEKDVAGCMDPLSENFNPDANIDSGDCQYRGCTDPDSETFDAKATIDDGSCEYRGCMDENSLNYDAQATIDDGSCMYARDAFVGTYSGTETCTSDQSGASVNASWSMTITDAPDDVTMVTIINLGDYGVTLDGTVEDDKITFDNTGTGSVITLVGSGTLNGNELSFTYNAAAGSASETCTGTATKQ